MKVFHNVLRVEVFMNKEQLQKIDWLTLDLNMDLSVLNSAVMSFNDDLQICDLINFVERIYKTSDEIREIFDNSF
jgi:hypothetical protein